MKIAAARHLVAFVGFKNQGVIGSRVDLGRQEAINVSQGIAYRAMHLGGAAQRVGILHPGQDGLGGDAALVGQGDLPGRFAATLRACRNPADIVGGAGLSGVRPGGMNTGIKGGQLPSHGFQA
jgi:hypothetical protein